MVKRKKLVLWTTLVCSFALVAGLAACAPKQSNVKTTYDTTEQARQVETPAADEYGVVVAESWKDIYPDQYATYMENASNSPDSGKHNYLELYPALNTMYKGYAFALGYDEASSHLYTLQSVSETPRTTQKAQLANCISCKTPQFTALVASEGPSVYAQPFGDLIGEFTEPISCWNCHENDPSSLTVGNQFFVNALGSDVDSVKAPIEAQVCGQCHNEYYFDPDTKATTNPYTGLDAMTPDAILAYYDSRNYKDWEHADTLAPMLKVQHPEFETIYGGEQTRMAKNGYTCSDCHMAPTEGDDGTFTSHNWTSPLENEELLANDCNNCHVDLKKEVAEWQAQEEDRVNSISMKIEQLTQGIASKYADEIAAIKAAKEAGTTQAPSDGLAQLQKLQRNSQWYWDFVMVENSEGAHNPSMTMETLDKAEAAVDEGLALLA